MNEIRPFNGATIETSRLFLRPIGLADLQKMYENWASDDEVTKHLSWNTHQSIEETKRVITSWLLMYERPYFFQWVITIKETQEAIGTISLFDLKFDLMQAEIGYCLGKTFWNQGYATEALQGVIDYAFSRNNFRVLLAKHLIENPASGRVMEKCGMRYEGNLFKANCKSHQSGWLKCYKITIAMWEENQPFPKTR